MVTTDSDPDLVRVTFVASFDQSPLLGSVRSAFPKEATYHMWYARAWSVGERYCLPVHWCGGLYAIRNGQCFFERTKVERDGRQSNMLVISLKLG